MKYKPLIEPCKSCLGCQRLENPDFTGDKNCKYAEKKIGNRRKYGKESKAILEIKEV